MSLSAGDLLLVVNYRVVDQPDLLQAVDRLRVNSQESREENVSEKVRQANTVHIYIQVTFALLGVFGNQLNASRPVKSSSCIFLEVHRQPNPNSPSEAVLRYGTIVSGLDLPVNAAEGRQLTNHLIPWERSNHSTHSRHLFHAYISECI